MHNGLFGLIMEGCVEGRNHEGRPHIEYIQQIIQDPRCNSYKEIKRKVNNRSEWRIAAYQYKKRRKSLECCSQFKKCFYSKT